MLSASAPPLSSMESAPQIEGAAPVQRQEKTENPVFIELIKKVTAISERVAEAKLKAQNYIDWIVAQPANKILIGAKFETWNENRKERSRYQDFGKYRVELFQLEIGREKCERENRAVGNQFEPLMSQYPKDPGVKEFRDIYKSNADLLEYEQFWGENGVLIQHNLREIKKYIDGSGCQIL